MPSNTTNTIIATCTVFVLVGIGPILTLTKQSDNVTQEELQREVDRTVTDVANTAIFTRDSYLDLQNTVDSLGDYVIEVEIQQTDDTQDIKTSLANSNKTGENTGVTMYTSQVEELFETNDKIILGEGWRITINVTSAAPTLNQSLESSFLGVSNADESAISASSSAMCTVSGTNN